MLCFFVLILYFSQFFTHSFDCFANKTHKVYTNLVQAQCNVCSLFVGVDCMADKRNLNESYILVNEKPAFLQ